MQVAGFMYIILLDKGIYYYFKGGDYACSSCSNNEKLDNVTLNRDEKLVLRPPGALQVLKLSQLVM